jgi:alpha-galactosidase
LWVEPARVDLAMIDKPGTVRERWLATRQREYGSDLTAQICLANEEAWQWLLARLVDLVTRVRPDYLKWDNNFWINCDRTDHGHGARDGAFAHMRGLYTVLTELRRRFPDLLIENVSGGGNILDFGLIGLTDVGWMDDRTSPSAHVRHNLEGLTLAFPPAYLLSFVIDADGEPLAGNDDLALVVRSRMPAALGITYRSDRIQDDTAAALAQQIRDYKTIRAIVSDASATLLSGQAPVESPGWDVIQETARDGANVLIFAFKSDADEGRVVVRPRALVGDATYDVRSLDAGPLGEATGDVLM